MTEIAFIISLSTDLSSGALSQLYSVSTACCILFIIFGEGLRMITSSLK